jgi:hypothetical protein
VKKRGLWTDPGQWYCATGEVQYDNMKEIRYKSDQKGEEKSLRWTDGILKIIIKSASGKSLTGK